MRRGEGESAECGRRQTRSVKVGSGEGAGANMGANQARRDEAGESEGGISSEKLSKISGLYERGELGA